MPKQDDPGDSERNAVPEQTSADTAAVRTILSEQLLQGGQEVLIRHNAQIYRLRLTKNGKLILHK